jgi:uncharacterized membrane protein
MKIIFLDIDGVLALMHQSRDEYGSLFHQQYVDNLAMIIENTGAKIVISSSWRSSGIEEMKNMWAHRNLPGEVIGCTGYNKLRFRGLEIAEYLNKNCQFQRINWSRDRQEEMIETSKCKNYVILDDDSDMTYSQKEHFVKCSCNQDHPDAMEGFGLTRQNAYRAIKILNTPLVELYYD